MLRFSVYDDQGPARDWPLTSAYLMTADEVAAPGKIRFKEGQIVCQKEATRSVALSLQYDTIGMGRLMLQTCLLPSRAEPYTLSVELARHRIKTFIAKSEEWQMFDLSAGHPATRHWEEARQLLTSALTTADPLEADQIARQSLDEAIEATERLAMAHAEVLLHRRYAGRAASTATLGVRIWPNRDGRQLRELIATNFDLLVMPLRWRDLEVEEGRFNWDSVDRWMDWAREHEKPIIAGPLLDFSKDAMPEWMYVWQHDYDTCRDLAYDYMERLVDRYKNVVGMWNLASGLNVNDNFTFTANQMVDLARMASLLVRQSRKGARTMIELREPFGEHCAERRDSMPPFAFVDRLVQEGIKFDALGVQLLFGERNSGRASRDLMQISNLLDRFFLLEIPLLLSAVGVPSEMRDPGGGWWHEPWSPELQARWVSRVFAMAMSKPFVESIFWTDLYDHEDAQLAAGGLLNASGQPKPAFSRLIGMRKRLRKPLGPLKLPTRTSEVTRD